MRSEHIYQQERLGQQSLHFSYRHGDSKMRPQEQEFSQKNGVGAKPLRSELRPSEKSSDMRNGRGHEDVVSPTIRAVTPEAGSSAAFNMTALPSPRSFPKQNYTTNPNWDPSASVSNTDEESTAQKRRRKIKQKTRNKDEVSSDASPNSFLGKTRKRLGSITTAASYSPKAEETVSSIGYPSVIQASVFPDLSDMRQQLPPKTPRRTFSSDAAVTPFTAPVRSPTPGTTDSSRILQLMKTICGRMQGILFYRPIGTTSWNSGYCAINVAPGSLVCQTKGEVSNAKVLIPDLRGCSVRTQYGTTAEQAILNVVLPASGLGFQLRPHVPETFDSWLAALLCWQPLRPKGVHDKMTKLQSVAMTERKPVERRMSDMPPSRSTTTIKAGQMELWNGPMPIESYRSIYAWKDTAGTVPCPWTRVSCTLHEDGALRLFSEENVKPLRAIRLSQLSRCSVQRLDQSVLNARHCIAIFPQHRVKQPILNSSNPLMLRLDSRVAFEAWYVLLRAFTVPELYGPEILRPSSATPTPSSEPTNEARDMYRIERSISVKITEVKFTQGIADELYQQTHSGQPRPLVVEDNDINIYADVVLGRDLRARTSLKSCKGPAFWAEEFRLEDLPPTLSRISVIVKAGTHGEKEWTMITKDGYRWPGSEDLSGLEGVEIASHDPMCGRVDVDVSDLEETGTMEKWWSLVDSNGVHIGQLLMRISLTEDVVLMQHEYMELSQLLHRFENSLTTQIAQVLGSDLKQLSDVLLNIFQSSDKVDEWINNLIEEEIDGIYRETPPVRMRFSSRIHSNDSYESAEHREVLVRDLSRSATMEANLLFRGNSLVTKALDAHMQRIGKDYLRQILGETIRFIIAKDPNCEVDPSKIKSSDQLEKNWTNLINLTSIIWKSIADSAKSCPFGMRSIMKHIRSCAEDRYGSFIRTVKYTSVSGFLFLRFFCPAILNPKLFGLINEHPPERPRRTLTLIAKSLIVLANMSKFGQKEPWMEPMNKFLASAATEFKDFLEEVCSIDPSQPSKPLEPQYQTPIQIKSRLPVLSREGLPSLPFLLDPTRLLATLIELWLQKAPSNIVDTGIDDCLQAFHGHCLKLRHRTQECISRAEGAGEPDNRLEHQWQMLLSGQGRRSERGGSISDLEIMSISSKSRERTFGPDYEGVATFTNIMPGPVLPSPTSYSTDQDRPMTSEQRLGDLRALVSSKNSSTVSIDYLEEARARPLPSSRDGTAKKRFLDITTRRKGRNSAPDKNHHDNEVHDI